MVTPFAEKFKITRAHAVVAFCFYAAFNTLYCMLSLNVIDVDGMGEPPTADQPPT